MINCIMLTIFYNNPLLKSVVQLELGWCLKLRRRRGIHFTPLLNSKRLVDQYINMQSNIIINKVVGQTGQQCNWVSDINVNVPVVYLID